MEASEQIKVLNEQLQVQKKAVGKKSEACEILLKDISEKTEMGKEKQQLAQTKSVEMEEQNKVSIILHAHTSPVHFRSYINPCVSLSGYNS